MVCCGACSIDREAGLAALLKQRITTCSASSEGFVGAQIPPLPKREVSEADTPDADALEADDVQADQLAHATDLPLATFAQNEAQLVFVLPGDLCGTQFPPIER